MTAPRTATAIGQDALDTRPGEIELQIPKLRQGSYFPGSLSRPSAPRRRS